MAISNIRIGGPHLSKSIEVNMPGFESAMPEPPEGEIKRETDLQLDGAPNTSEQIKPENDNPDAISEPLVEWGKIPSRIERFSNLSSDMIALISELSQEANKAMDQLRSIREKVDLKKAELKKLRDMEESAVELQRLIKNRRLQIADLDRHLESQRNAFETERSRREQEEKKYLDNLKAQRQREQEEYREEWAAEQLKAKQTLEEELRAIRKESLEKQEALDRELLEREQRIMQKEEELELLTQELEQFMSRLAGRTQLRTTVQDDCTDTNPFPVQDV